MTTVHEQKWLPKQIQIYFLSFYYVTSYKKWDFLISLNIMYMWASCFQRSKIRTDQKGTFEFPSVMYVHDFF